MFGFPILVFDIETITDVQSGCHLHDLHLESEDDAEQALQKIRRQQVGHDFPPLPLHQIVCISGFWIEQDRMQLFSWTAQDNNEAEILQKFVGIFEKKTPILVSWNGRQFDIPVILYRCLYHGISAPSLFEQGEWNPQKKYNNYQNRYHTQHTDLMDILAGFNLRNYQKLDEMAQVLGYPGKCGVSGYQVSDYVKAGQWQELKQYCESDVLNTWLIYLRWLLLRGYLNHQQHRQWIQQTIYYLRQLPLHQSFLQAWQNSSRQTTFTAQDFQGH